MYTEKVKVWQHRPVWKKQCQHSARDTKIVKEISRNLGRFKQVEKNYQNVYSAKVKRQVTNTEATGSRGYYIF